MIRIKVYKLSQVIKAAVIGLLVIAAFVTGIFMIVGGKNDRQTTSVTEASAQLDASLFADKSLQNKDAMLLQTRLPLVPEAVPVTAEGEQADISDVPDRIHVQIMGIDGEYESDLSADKPRVLIYHTHSYEAFAQDAENPYKETTQWRTEDRAHNIMAVGAQLAKELEELGIEVIHDLTEHEPPKLGTAYVRSLETLQSYADAGIEFDMMIDLHRDAASARNTDPSTVMLNGEPCARLMMLIGTGEGSEGNRFSIVPDWKENYKLARALTEELNETVDNICREVMVRTGRYNQHMSKNAILIEVGHNENTLQEAMRATQPLAKAIACILKGDG